MDYEKKYKEALEKARQLCVYPTSKPFISDLQDLFPELKESGDERIRKFLHHTFTVQYLAEDELGKWHGEPVSNILAWLEKQGKKEQDARYENLEELLAADDIYQMAMNDEMVREAKDKAVNALHEMCIGRLLGIEKQSEQNLIMAKSPQLGEQKPADKVEPKFHEDDWIVQENIGIYKVIEICESWYEVVDNKDKHYSIGFDKEYMCHLWTIQDAKDGDVLVASDGSIFLFAGVVDCACKYYAALTPDNYFKINKEAKGGYWETSRAVHPATKEQRDTLERAMADAGWEFDFEKKELKCLITNGGDFESENCEQKSNNKVEPKFKVGDWVVYNHNPNFLPKRIIQITNKEYVFVDGSFEIKTLEIDWHLWTIADAKNGDMLAEDSCIFIVKKMNPNGTAIVSCCLFDDGDFDLGSTLSFDVNSTYPATKEQRVKFFAKMHEAGFGWDAEKKELKKIEESKNIKNQIMSEITDLAKDYITQKSAWSGEDNTHYDDICEILINLIHSDTAKVNKDVVQRDLNWFTSLRDRVQPQPKQEWDKEDERMYRGLYNLIYFTPYCDSRKKLSDWLKSIKQRMKDKL